MEIPDPRDTGARPPDKSRLGAGIPVGGRANAICAASGRANAICVAEGTCRRWSEQGLNLIDHVFVVTPCSVFLVVTDFVFRPPYGVVLPDIFHLALQQAVWPYSEGVRGDEPARLWSCIDGVRVEAPML